MSYARIRPLDPPYTEPVAAALARVMPPGVAPLALFRTLAVNERELEMTPASPSDPFNLVGTLLDRKYRIDRVVAEGGFGIVYAGHHLALDAPVAVKALKWAAELDADQRAELMACFLLEAKIIARLRHPHVVSVRDAGVAQVTAVPAGVPWMVLEWLDGETLNEHLGRCDRGGHSPRACLELMRPVLAAMAHAHQLGIVHCDLKANNILIVPGDSGPTPKVLDFGIAKILEVGQTHPDQTTANRAIAFSAVCAAPEQISGACTGPWTDVHALGLLLTQICTGKPTYPVNDPIGHHRAVFDKARPTPAHFGVDVGAWEPVLEKALALRGGDRHANAAELLSALESALDSDGAAPHVHAREPDSPSESTPGAAKASPESPAMPVATPRSTKRGWQLLAIAAAGFGRFGAARQRNRAARAHRAHGRGCTGCCRHRGSGFRAPPHEPDPDRRARQRRRDA